MRMRCSALLLLSCAPLSLASGRLVRPLVRPHQLRLPSTLTRSLAPRCCAGRPPAGAPAELPVTVGAAGAKGSGAFSAVDARNGTFVCSYAGERPVSHPRLFCLHGQSHTRVLCLHGQSHTHTRVCLFRTLAPPHFFPHIQSHQCIFIFIFLAL